VNLLFAPQQPVELSDESYHLLNEVLEQRFGLQFPANRRAVLQARLQPRLRALSLTDGLEYYAYLRANNGAESRELAKAVTNNETYFFRERDQFDALFNGGDDVLTPSSRILSAACSSGEEAFTLSFYAKDLASRTSLASVRVDAFDLDADRLAVAGQGECRTRSLRQMSSEEQARYLESTGPDRWKVRDIYRKGVSFRHANLVDRRAFDGVAPYDAVFCRNALIYFSRPAMMIAIENLAAALRPGGLLFLGHSESIIGLFPKLETIRIGKCIAYRKVA
jgi:chemotaxis protein methyltransferase CheR